MFIVTIHQNNIKIEATLSSQLTDRVNIYTRINYIKILTIKDIKLLISVLMKYLAIYC